jgi:hypothetical protein
MKKKEQPRVALKNFYDICPIIPVGVGYLIRQPMLIHFLQQQPLLLPEV